MFNKESDFENALIQLLSTKGWEAAVLNHPGEEDLIANWQAHLDKTNKHIDRLDVPLLRSEMDQILEQVQTLKTPYALNGFINGKTVAIKREHPESRHFGKEVSLEIFDREEISAGKSRYQIARRVLKSLQEKNILVWHGLHKKDPTQYFTLNVPPKKKTPDVPSAW